MREASFSAPGKLILAGEHAVVYGHPALVAAVNLRLHVQARTDASITGARLELPNLGRSESLSWDELFDSHDLDTESLVRQDLLAKLAVHETARKLGTRPSAGLWIRVSSELPPGSGFGSSAALSVALPATILSLLGETPDAKTLESISSRIEGHQHASPSGIDTAAALNGGVLWAEPRVGGPLTVRPMETIPSWIDRVRVFQSGVPREGTGVVVKAVARLRHRDPSDTDAHLGILSSCARALREDLDEDVEARRGVCRSLRAAHGALVALGVVPKSIAETIQRIEDEGGAAKISGAGALTGPGAGSILVYHPEPERIESWSFLADWQRVEVRLGAPGLRKEKTE